MPGDFTLLPEFITTAEESQLLAELPHPDAKPREPERNAIFRYGICYIYTTHHISKEVPPMLDAISRRLCEQGHLPTVCRSITVNQYCRGQIIKPHVDDPKCGPIITVLSLVSPATLRFTHETEPAMEFLLLPRSVSLMSGELRLKWRHEILPVPEERWSVVFRR